VSSLLCRVGPYLIKRLFWLGVSAGLMPCELAQLPCGLAQRTPRVVALTPDGSCGLGNVSESSGSRFPVLGSACQINKFYARKIT
jgi:hypothetical protein